MHSATHWRLVVGFGALFAIALAVAPAAARAADPCATANPLLARIRAFDRDHDGLGNCRERQQLGTSPRDPDSDDDGVDDGDEVGHGTDPLDGDSDDDGAGDGDEDRAGSDPRDADSDDDGLDDGEDPDPVADLHNEIEGDVRTLTCGASPSLVVLGIPIRLTAATRYDGVAGCDELAALLGAGTRVHVEVEVEGDLSMVLVATEIGLDDRDGDGRPEDLDDDDDGNGIDDDEDENDDGRDEQDDDDGGHDGASSRRGMRFR